MTLTLPGGSAHAVPPGAVALMAEACGTLQRIYRLRELAALATRTAVRLMGSGQAVLFRLDRTGMAEVLGATRSEGPSIVGTKFDEASPPWGARVAVSSPIEVRGERWGALVALPETADCGTPEITAAIDMLTTLVGARISRVALDLLDERTLQAREIGSRMAADVGSDRRDLAAVVARYDNALRTCFLADGIAFASPHGAYASGCLTLAQGFVDSIAIRAPHGLLVTEDVETTLPGVALGRAAGLAAIDVDGRGGAWLLLGRIDQMRGRGRTSTPFESWIVPAAESLRTALLGCAGDEGVASPSDPSTELLTADLMSLEAAHAGPGDPRS